MALGVAGAAVLIVVLALAGGGESGGERSADGGAGGAGGEGGREAPARATISVSGDLLIHSPVFAAAQANAGGSGYDFVPMLRPIRRFVERPDLGICHLETPLTRDAPTGYPVFAAPADLAEGIANTGWDACTTASNHAVDGGQEGIDTTLRLLDRAGVEHAGTAASRRGARRPLILEAGGIEVALLSYTTDLNGLAAPNRWSVNLAKRGRILADAKAAREAGAEAVIVNVHWASEIVAEYSPEPSSDQKRLARALARSSDVTAVVGQGPHVVQPIRMVAGKPVIYSEGNLISNQTEACCAAASQDGLIALLDLIVDGDGDRVEGVSYVPVWVRHPDYAVLPVGEALRSGDADEAALRASYERTVGVAGRGNGVAPDPRRPR